MKPENCPCIKHGKSVCGYGDKCWHYGGKRQCAFCEQPPKPKKGRA